MNKLILVLVMVLSVLSAGAQEVKDDWGERLVRLNYRMWIDLSHHCHRIGTISDMGTYVDTDIRNNYWFSIHDGRDFSYPDHLLKSMRTGQHLYIKFDNDSIIDLVCGGCYGSSVYYRLSSDDIYLLITHDIVKIRLEHGSRYDDPEFKIKRSDAAVAVVQLHKDYDNYKARLQRKAEDAEKQKQMKTNPLYNF